VDTQEQVVRELTLLAAMPVVEVAGAVPVEMHMVQAGAAA
jgi:hypothetical protein